MSTEAKKSNIAQHALHQLEQFVVGLKLNILPKFLEQVVSQDPLHKTHAEQKNTQVGLLAKLKKLSEYNSDCELLKKHHNRRIDNLYNPDNKNIADRSPYEQLIRDGASTAFKDIKTCIKEAKSINPELNYFYILYNLNDLLLNYWDIKNRLQFDKTNFKENLTALYSLNLQVQMLLVGFQNILPKNDPLKKILEIIGFTFWAEEVNHLKNLIKAHNIDLNKILEQAKRLKPQQIAAYPTLNITAKEFENYQQKINDQKIAADNLQDADNRKKHRTSNSIRLGYHAKLGFHTPPPSPAAKPTTAPIDAAGKPIPPLKRHHNTI